MALANFLLLAFILQQVVSSPLFNGIEEFGQNGVQEVKAEILDNISQNGAVPNVQISSSDLMMKRGWEDYGAKLGKYGKKLKRKPKHTWRKTKKRWERFRAGFKHSK